MVSKIIKFLNRDLFTMNQAALVLAVFSFLSQVFGLLRDPAGLSQAAGAARAAAITNAAQRLADLVERVAMPERVGETV